MIVSGLDRATAWSSPAVGPPLVDGIHLYGNLVELSAVHLPPVIAATVASDPVKYSEAFLEKSKQEYCSWIQDPEKWGDAVNFFFPYIGMLFYLLDNYKDMGV
ncbi:hypothetical protein WN944_002067 [Citrus x changshan-huyou]|uniref:Ubiquitin thioesterase OTU n=1 Tax=Citrus x changshan-huyou TaxID=2935761 RepID=A0AAP0MFW6_9ROSI